MSKNTNGKTLNPFNNETSDHKGHLVYLSGANYPLAFPWHSDCDTSTGREKKTKFRFRSESIFLSWTSFLRTNTRSCKQTPTPRVHCSGPLCVAPCCPTNETLLQESENFSGDLVLADAALSGDTRTEETFSFQFSPKLQKVLSDFTPDGFKSAHDQLILLLPIIILQGNVKYLTYVYLKVRMNLRLCRFSWSRHHVIMIY